ncbi:MAG TPA: fructose-specific PTS transporter subunit EIIC [Nocardioidaceae bacterium]|nr:fructose-specific PTS transporter subunit EIIC [Nocardioidaceae bacterium]
MVPELINSDLVVLDAQLGGDKTAVITSLAQVVASAGRSSNAAGLAEDAFAREAKAPTGMPGGLAIPHCRSEHVSEATLAFARLKPPIDFGAKDGPADLVFMIAAPASGDQEHLRLLTKLARALIRPDFTASLRAARTTGEVVQLVSAVVQLDEAAPPEAASAAVATSAQAASPDAPAALMTIVAVTSCPTGIAHTYMAAEALAKAGEKAGVNVVVEPQGSVGAETIDPEVIRSASAAIFATDVGVRDQARFAGLPEIKTGVQRGIHNADELVTQAVAAASDPNAPRVAAGTGSGASGGGRSATAGGLGTRLRTALLTGVSYMIPFVAAGGLLIALGFLLGGYELALTYTAHDFTGGNLGEYVLANYKLTSLPPGDLSSHALLHSGLLLYLGAVMFKIGGLAFAFLIPALAGYIAFAIADRPGIAPGFVAGSVAVLTNAGFIGGIIGGLLAGVVALYLAGLKVPPFVRGLMPVVIIPLFTCMSVGLLMYVVLAKPLSWITTQLTDGLNSMSGSSAVLLGVVLGLMMCFDLGGPVNKAAYLFATAGLADQSTASFRIMAAVMISGMVPPLALALAATIRPGLFTEPELENGRAAWLLGASFISEGAIPFAAADPFRVIPAVMVGGAVAGGLAELMHVGLHAPHGGIFVLFAVDNKLSFLIALVAGTVVAAALVVGLKGYDRATSTIEEPALVNA